MSSLGFHFNVSQKSFTIIVRPLSTGASSGKKKLQVLTIVC